MMETTPLLTAALYTTLVLLTAALALGLVRLVKGPSLADRVVALDVIALVVVGLIVVDALRQGQPLLLRPALLVGLVGFLATVAFASNLLRRDKP